MKAKAVRDAKTLNSSCVQGLLLTFLLLSLATKCNNGWEHMFVKSYP